LERVRRRLLAAAWIETSAVCAAAAAVVFAAATWSGSDARWSAAIALTFLAGALTAAIVHWRGRWTPAAAAKAIERAAPDSRNVVVTAEELLRHPDRVRPAIQARVHERAERVGAGIVPSHVVPLRRPVAVGAASLAMTAAIAALALRPEEVSLGSRHSDGTRATTAAVASSVTATITPPSYVAEPPRTIADPGRIEAVENSHLRLDLRGATGWLVRFGSAVLQQQRSEGGVVVELALTQSGYLAIEPDGGDEREQRRLVPVVVTPDRAPTITVEAPGKDLLLPDAKPTIPIAASATDDYAIASLDLRYTKISGSGEQFEFQEGSIPLRISRGNERAWKAEAELALSRLGLTPGDSLVYRLVGRDRRPGDAGFASSDTFFVEVAGPGQIALEGFELPPDKERYALSQQMIVLKLERLRARQRTLDRSTLEQEVGNLAAEQRAVRANFIFLTGGTVEDEEEEAEHSHEIQEGRLANTARQEIARAIQHMGRVEQELAAIDTGAALPPARAAVEALQRAFGRNRYFLRTVPVRSRVDPSRRLSGNLSEASAWRRELFPPAGDDAAAKARMLLARVVELSPQIRDRTLPSAALTAIAEAAIGIDPASTEWQDVAKGLLGLRDDTQGSPADRAGLLDRTVGAIAGLVRRDARAASRSGSASDPLRSAWQDAREQR
jgi:hypothetical protein